MKIRLSNEYFRPREVLLETEEECQMLDTVMHFAERYESELKSFIRHISNKEPTVEQWRRFMDFINNIEFDFNEQKPLWRE